MQPQGHLQVVVNLADYGMNSQVALDAARWHFVPSKTVLLEQAVSQQVVQKLLDRGHNVSVSAEPRPLGKAQVILRQDGVFMAASEPRADGMALAW